jgi:hypothetical protein
VPAEEEAPAEDGTPAEEETPAKEEAPAEEGPPWEADTEDTPPESEEEDASALVPLLTPREEDALADEEDGCGPPDEDAVALAPLLLLAEDPPATEDAGVSEDGGPLADEPAPLEELLPVASSSGVPGLVHAVQTRQNPTPAARHPADFPITLPLLALLGHRWNPSTWVDRCASEDTTEPPLAKFPAVGPWRLLLCHAPTQVGRLKSARHKACRRCFWDGTGLTRAPPQTHPPAHGPRRTGFPGSTRTAAPPG